MPTEPSVGPPIPIIVAPMWAKVVATSGWARNHCSICHITSDVASREVPGGVLNSTIMLPESALGKNSPGSREPAAMASTIEATAIPVVLSRFASVQSSTRAYARSIALNPPSSRA